MHLSNHHGHGLPAELRSGLEADPRKAALPDHAKSDGLLRHESDRKDLEPVFVGCRRRRRPAAVPGKTGKHC